MKREKKDKSIMAKITSWISIILLLCCFGLVVYCTVGISKTGFVRLFGYSFHIVVTDSMTPEINVGDLVVAKKTDKSEIVVNDDIVFVSEDPVLRGNMVVHRVKTINEDGTFTTQGIKKGASEDKYHVAEPIGKVVAVSSGVGKVFSFIIKYRFFVFIALLVILVIVCLSEATSIAINAKAQKEVKAEMKNKDEENKK